MYELKGYIEDLYEKFGYDFKNNILKYVDITDDFDGQFRIIKVEFPYYVESSEYNEVLKILQPALKEIMPEAHVRIHIFASKSTTKDYLLEL